jgi:hypothetical protein
MNDELKDRSALSIHKSELVAAAWFKEIQR